MCGSGGFERADWFQLDEVRERAVEEALADVEQERDERDLELVEVTASDALTNDVGATGDQDVTIPGHVSCLVQYGIEAAGDERDRRFAFSFDWLVLPVRRHDQRRAERICSAPGL